MKVIIAGSRSITDRDLVQHVVLAAGFDIKEVVSGCARGVDRIGELLAEEWRLPIKRFPADWNRWGREAGHRRNAEMLRYADALIAVKAPGHSPGTSNIIYQNRTWAFLPMFTHTVGDDI